MDYQLLGSRIRERRRTLDMTQETLADSANISGSMIGHIERGTRVPSLETTVRICKSLEVPLTAIIPTNDTCTDGHNDDMEKAKKLLQMALEIANDG